MKNENHIHVLLAVTLAAATLAAAPLGTGITYQGLLTDAGTPVAGTVDLRFRLFDAANGGAELGVVTIEDLAVSEGRVTAHLDFGDHFGGEARWLQIEVREGSSEGSFEVLPERQPLLATPHGLHAGETDHAAAADHAMTTADAATLDGLTPAYILDFANLVGVPGGLSDGDDDTAAALSCVTGEMPSWNGASWGCDPDDTATFARTAVVGPVGDAVANGAALLAAVAALPSPSSREEGWMVEIEPGFYDLGVASLDLPPWVTLRGAGEIFTVITSSVCSTASAVTATILGDHRVEIAELTVENTCSSGSLHSRAVSFDGTHKAGRLYRVTARATGAAGGCVAVFNRSENSVFDRVTAEVTGCSGQSDAIFTSGNNALLTDCIASAGGTGENNGLFIGSRTFVSRGAFEAVDSPGEDDAAVAIEATADLLSVNASCPDVAVRLITFDDLTVALTRLIATGAVEVEDQGGSLVMVIEHSRIIASGPTVIGDSNSTVGIAMTQLAGGAVSPSGGALDCAGIWDELWTPYATTCP